ncbi:heavy metal-associated isoprenylated plant protein 39-like [Apium graveolens]|uniref:heavy metal-associated isoprenylated plant protein 39-like n=1 Tax=Apium graveolens TaxID=4045 RepID=UPI003D7B49AA
MKKVVVKVDIFEEKEKKKALKTVSSLSGIASISIDMSDRKLTVIGDVDPIGVVNKLRKLWHAELLSVGPDKEPEKNKDDEKKKEEEAKKKKAAEEKEKEEKKKNQDEHVQYYLKNYQNYPPYATPQYAPQYVVTGADDYPSSCVIS